MLVAKGVDIAAVAAKVAEKTINEKRGNCVEGAEEENA